MSTEVDEILASYRAEVERLHGVIDTLRAELAATGAALEAYVEDK